MVLWLLQRPDCQFVAVGICEMESLATGKIKDVLYYGASCRNDLFLSSFNIVGIEDDKNCSFYRVARGKSTVYIVTFKCRIVRAVIDKFPAKTLCIKFFGAANVF